MIQLVGTSLGFDSFMQAVIREADSWHQHNNANIALFPSLGYGESAQYALDPITPQTRGGLSICCILDCEQGTSIGLSWSRKCSIFSARRDEKLGECQPYKKGPGCHQCDHSVH